MNNYYIAIKRAKNKSPETLIVEQLNEIKRLERKLIKKRKYHYYTKTLEDDIEKLREQISLYYEIFARTKN